MLGSFHSSLLEKICAIKCSIVNCLADSHQGISSGIEYPDAGQPDTNIILSTPTANFGLPPIDDSMIIKEIIIDESMIAVYRMVNG